MSGAVESRRRQETDIVWTLKIRHQIIDEPLDREDSLGPVLQGNNRVEPLVDSSDAAGFREAPKIDIEGGGGLPTKRPLEIAS
jgi:hypothetical protein